MRILDCKSPECGKIAKGAPVMLDYLCDECRTEFDALKRYLDEVGIEYNIDPGIVRGLDYYTRTVFEITSDALGAQSTVCGGGRYNGLVEELGGKPTDGIGFALGIERLILIIKKQGLNTSVKEGPALFVAALGEAADIEAQKIVYGLRNRDVWAERDLCQRSVKAQMKYANKLGSKFSIVLGDDEVEKGTAKLKNMETGETTEVALDVEEIYYAIV